VKWKKRERQVYFRGGVPRRIRFPWLNEVKVVSNGKIYEKKKKKKRKEEKKKKPGEKLLVETPRANGKKLGKGGKTNQGIRTQETSVRSHIIRGRGGPLEVNMRPGRWGHTTLVRRSSEIRSI